VVGRALLAAAAAVVGVAGRIDAAGAAAGLPLATLAVAGTARRAHRLGIGDDLAVGAVRAVGGAGAPHAVAALVAHQRRGPARCGAARRGGRHRRVIEGISDAVPVLAVETIPARRVTPPRRAVAARQRRQQGGAEEPPHGPDGSTGETSSPA